MSESRHRPSRPWMRTSEIPNRLLSCPLGFARRSSPTIGVAIGSLRTRDYDYQAGAGCGDPEVAEEFMPIIHLIFSNLKNWLSGIHHGVSAKHL